MRQYFAVAMLAISKASKIDFRDDIDASNYRASWADYRYEFPYPMGDEPDCVATMVTDQIAVTSAHCFTKDLKPFDVQMWDGEVYTVSDIRPNDCWDLENTVPNTADIALFVLDRPIPNAQPNVDFVQVWSENELGTEVRKTFTVMGWGEFGPKSRDLDELDYGIFNRGENIIEEVHDNMIVYTFDS